MFKVFGSILSKEHNSGIGELIVSFYEIAPHELSDDQIARIIDKRSINFWTQIPGKRLGSDVTDESGKFYFEIEHAATENSEGCSSRLSMVGDSQVCNGIYAGKLLDPALKDYYLQTAGNIYNNLTDEEVRDLTSYLPRLEENLFQIDGDGQFIHDQRGRPSVRRKAGGQLELPPTDCDYGEYLYRKNNTRRFLVDSNNLYLDIRPSEGAALEPFKRVHRYMDALNTAANVEAARLKNLRRAQMLANGSVFDPDIQKVIIVENANLVSTIAANVEGNGEVVVSSSGSAVANDGDPPIR
jgi:hypothetical protein